ncbi:MAG TPA: M12 family metallo-peptidase, partial [Ferruginibacter sp.]|nr:M12 family metallo-peptidase [Ferruginibacter sp.]
MTLSLQRISLLISFVFLFTVFAKAQIKVVKLFEEEKVLPNLLKDYVSRGAVCNINKMAVEQLFNTKPAAFNLQFSFENKAWEIELKESELFSKGFFVRTSGNQPFNYNQNEILHYKGKIKDQPGSFAAISILHNEVIAVLADKNGNINIGALTNSQSGDGKEHIIYREADLIAANPFVCGSDNLPEANQNPLPQFAAPVSTNAVLNTEPVDIYFEADYSCYTGNGSNITNTVNRATALFNVVTTLYENDSVYTKMSGIKVWSTTDPYTSLTTTSPVLYAFSTNMSSGFPGDLAHLLSRRSLGGGIAWLNVLCNSAYYRTGVSANLNNTTNPFPTYSWNSMVVTHELGHNIASRHTQSCTWPGGAIDNCYTTEGGCAQGPAPVNGGTIMSYCHLTGYGINLANGFGPLPGAAIRNAVRTSTCIYPRITFSTNFNSVTEENATIENDCLDYSILNLKLAVNYTPSQPAIISLLPTHIASPGLQIGADKDVEISTTGFTLSDTTPQIIQLKIFDD